ncbi:hypothetical protein BOX15_Mlig021696g1 [Macrostomum lignano]|uniref:Plasminogen receptor (KT) n=2 Tax=Macrostomum lignano TaxID=282301 RepID=A0A1I8H3L1_9PLAT|nr:hypothetical protein BOX15_Mlig021696g1 [Macrostomum lignano]
MGNPVSKIMDSFSKKNQETMAEMQKLTLCRQLEMQNAMRERMMAAQIARGRELFNWTASFYALAFAGAAAAARHGKKVAMAPIVPFTFIIAYQYDLCYGSKMQRIRRMAENILADEFDLTSMPNGMVTLDEIDRRRLASQSPAK